MQNCLKLAASLSIVLLPGFLLVSSCNSKSEQSDQSKNISEMRSMEDEDLAKRGMYLVTFGGCNDCHSPKNFGPEGVTFDSSRLLSGHPATDNLPPFDPAALKPGNYILFSPGLTAAIGPWGISYPANLTPDSATGIGAWDADIFIKTLRSGKHLGQADGRPIMPPMPWESVRNLNDDDLKAVFTYLRSLPPINNRVPNYKNPEEAIALTKK